MSSLFQLLKSEHKKIPFKSILNNQTAHLNHNRNDQNLQTQNIFINNKKNNQQNQQTIVRKNHVSTQKNKNKNLLRPQNNTLRELDQNKQDEQLISTSRAKTKSYQENQRMKMLKSLKQKRNSMKKQINFSSKQKQFVFQQESNSIYLSKLQEKDQQKIIKFETIVQKDKNKQISPVLTKNSQLIISKNYFQKKSLSLQFQNLNIMLNINQNIRRNKQTQGEIVDKKQFYCQTQIFSSNQNQLLFQIENLQNQKNQIENQLITIKQNLDKEINLKNWLAQQYQKNQKLLQQKERFELQTEQKIKTYQILIRQFSNNLQIYKTKNQQIISQTIQFKGTIQKLKKENKLILEDMHRINQELYENWVIVKQIKLYLEKIISHSKENLQNQERFNKPINNIVIGKIMEIIQTRNFNLNLFE